MHIFERAARTIFTIIIFPISMVTFVLAFISYYLVFNFASKENAPHIAHKKISRTWAYTLLCIFLVRVKIKNKNLIDENKVYVFISNHRSLLDIPAWATSSRNTVRFLSKEEMTKLPVFGYVIKRLYLTVNRSDKNDRVKSIQRMKESIDEGISVFLAPEGTRNKTKEPLQEFRDGAFRLAIASQKPVAILTLYKTDDLLSPKTLFGLRPGIIHGTWSGPIETVGMTDNDIQSLKQKAWNVMKDEYLKMETEFGL